MKKSRFYLSFLFLFVVVSWGFSAPAEPPAGDSNSPFDNPIEFDLRFSKPFVNDFFFSDPTDTTKFYGDSVKGVSFPIVSDSKNISEAKIGVTYRLDSKGTLQVFCNAKDDRTHANMMVNEKGDGLDFKIAIHYNDGTTQDKPSKAYNAKKPVFTYKNTKSMTAQKSCVLTMTIDVSNSVSGQYQGYLIMVFTPTK